MCESTYNLFANGPDHLRVTNLRFIKHQTNKLEPGNGTNYGKPFLSLGIIAYFRANTTSKTFFQLIFPKELNAKCIKWIQYSTSCGGNYTKKRRTQQTRTKEITGKSCKWTLTVKGVIEPGSLAVFALVTEDGAGNHCISPNPANGHTKKQKRNKEKLL